MSTLTVFEQMVIIIIMISIGYYVSKKGYIGDKGARDISFLILNVTNPAFVISCAFSDEGVQISHHDILVAMLLTVILYAVIVIFGHVLPFILGAKKQDRVMYTLLSIYSNVGFIGIPVASAVLGQEALIYVTLFNIMYTILFYTHGNIILLKDVEGADTRIKVSSFINIGTVAAIITILLFWFNIKLPMILEDTISYTGRATTFLAMMVLGHSFSKLPIRKLIGNVRVYLMVAIRYLAFPIVVVLILKSMFGSNIMVEAIALMFAVPAGNSPIMLATEHGINTDILSSGILVSTVLSVITVTITTMVL